MVPFVVPLDRDHLLAEAEGHADVAQVVLQRLGDLVVAEVEQAVALLDHGHLGAERREHGRVLDADHAAADDDERARQVRQLQDAVGVEHRRVVELDRLRPVRARADRDHDVVGRDAALLAARRDGDRVRVDEARVAVQQLHVVARQLVAHDVDLALDDGLRAPEEILDRDVVLDLVALRRTAASGTCRSGRRRPRAASWTGACRCWCTRRRPCAAARRRRRACRASRPGSRPSVRRGRSRSPAGRSRGGWERAP